MTRVLRSVFLFALLLIFIIPSISLSQDGWFDVRPVIQEVYLRQGMIGFEEVVIMMHRRHNEEWPIEELESQLTLMSIEHSRANDWDNNLDEGVYEEYPDYDETKVYLRINLWSYMAHRFESRGINGNPEDEGYIIHANKELAEVYQNGESIGEQLVKFIDISAASVRGLNYAVGTLIQAIGMYQGDPFVDAAVVFDYPYFPKRTAMFGRYFTGADDYWTPTTGPRSIIRMGYEVLLANKANGILHGGRPREYEGISGASTGDVITALNSFANDDNDVAGHNTNWSDLQLDWFESINAESWSANNFNSDEIYRAIQVECTCSIGACNGGYKELSVERKPAVFLENGEFNNTIPAGNLEYWYELPEYRITRGQNQLTGNYYARIEAPSGGGSRIEQRILLQQDVGTPARQMYLIYDVKCDSTENLSSDVSFQVRIGAIDCPNPENHWDYVISGGLEGEHCDDQVGNLVDEGEWHELPTSDEEGYSFWPLYSEKLVLCSSEPEVPAITEWRTDTLLFTTYGAQAAVLKLCVNNFDIDNGDIAVVHVDNVRLVDADLWDLYAFDTETNWGDVEIILHDNQGGSAVATADLIEDQTGYTGVNATNLRDKYKRAKISINCQSPPGSQNWDYAVVKYWTIANPARRIRNDGNGDPIWVHKREEYRSDLEAAEEYDEIMASNLSEFQSEMNERGMEVTGYYNYENEIRRAGWMPQENWYGFDNSPNAINIGKNFAEYTSHMYDALPDHVANPNSKEMYVWGDHFDPNHFAKRYMRRNNPFEPVYGLQREDVSSYEIPGMTNSDDLNNKLNFIIWSIAIPESDEEVLLQEIEETFEFWSPILSEEDNEFSGIIGNGAPEFNATFSGFSEFYEIVLEAVIQLRDEDVRIDGGFLYAWPKEWRDVYDSYEDWGEWLQWLWNPGNIVTCANTLPDMLTASEGVAELNFTCFAADSVDSTGIGELDSLVIEYALNGGESKEWQTIVGTGGVNNTYDFELNIPDYGGYCEYKVWAFANYGEEDFKFERSFPTFAGTYGEDQKEDDRLYFTFERRLTTDINSDTLIVWAPGILTQSLKIRNGGLVIVKPLPGYKKATLYLTDNTQINLDNTGAVPSIGPRLIFEGTDTTRIHIRAFNDTTKWGGIKDSLGQVEFKYVTFDKGLFPKLETKTTSMDSAIIFEESEFLDPLTIEGDLSIGGASVFAGIEIADSAHLTIIAGSEFTFKSGTSITLGDMSTLSIEGNDSMLVFLKAEVDSLGWSGIVSDNDNGTVELVYCRIENATSGVLCDGYGNTVYAENCEFVDCNTGILAVNGGSLESCDSYFHDNVTGIQLANLASAEIVDSDISNNDGSGISAFSRSLLQLENCVIDSNQGDGLAGGVGLFTGSVALMQCTEIENNEGPGICAYGGSLILTSADEVSSPLRNWRGNRIANNQTGIIAGQLNLKGRVGLGLINGHNGIMADTLNDGYLISWDDQQGCDIWSDVYWGLIDTTEILDLLPACVVLGSIDSSWSSCPAFTPDTTIHDSLLNIFLDPITNEFEDSLSTAYNQYYDLLADQEQSDYAFSASDRLLALNMLGYLTYDSTIARLTAIADSTSDLDLKAWLMNSIAWCWAELDSISLAESIYDSLTQNGNTDFQRASSEVQETMLLVHSIDNDTSVTNKPETIIAYIDSARNSFYELSVWDQYVITDSVVMYAPMRVDTIITIEQGGVLTILPHPGVQNPVVRFTYTFDMQQQIVKGGSFEVKGLDSTQVRGKLYILGNPENRLHLKWDDQSYAFDRGIDSWGIVRTENTDFEGLDYYSNQSGYTAPSWHLPVFQADSCTFSNFTKGLMFQWMDTSSYIHNCTFENVGTASTVPGLTGEACVTFYEVDDFDIDGCVFSNNQGVSVFYREGSNLEILSSEFIGSEVHGLFLWNGDMSVECSEISSNGDTLSEIRVLDGTLDLSGAHSIIADTVGPLIYSNDPSYVDLEDGENLFELYGGTGFYLQSGDTTETWDITWNTWEPYAPDDPEFYSHLYPSNPAKWTVDSSLADFLACGESAQSETGGSNWMITPIPYHEAGTSSIDEDSDDSMMLDLSRKTVNSSQKHQNADKKQALKGPMSKMAVEASKKASEDPYARKQSTKTTKQMAKSDLMHQHHRQLAEWREVKALSKRGDRQATLSATKQFIDEHPTSKLAPAAITKLSTLARQLGEESGVSKYLLEKSETLSDEKDRLLAKRLSNKALAYEGHPKDALMQLESMMATSPTPRDSVFALVDAMQVYYDFHQREELSPRYSNVRIESLPEMVQRTLYLARIMDDPNLAPDKEPVAVPKEYKLYQNYPNPFNPSTEIKFDLPETVPVKLMVYNILGQHVVTLIDEVRTAGTITIPWDGKNAAGVDVSTGMYIYQFKAGDFQKAKKMLLLK